ncbi:MAG: hypothetical protein ACXACW_11255 [Candidatus Hodarchaeales archaeon]|jgi:hypothetical protein
MNIPQPEFKLKLPVIVPLTVFVISFIILIFQIALLVQIPPTLGSSNFRIELIFWFGFILLLQLGTLFLAIGMWRQKIILTRDSIKFYGFRSTTIASWKSIAFLTITFEMATYQRYGWIAGKRGFLTIEASINGQPMEYKISNMTPDTVNLFLKELARLSRRVPKVTSPFHRGKLIEKQVWRWG